MTERFNTIHFFSKIKNVPDNYQAGHIIQRMIDGLGYRYYWSSENLRNEDLNYKPSDSGKSLLETIQHIYDLSETILNVSKQKANERPYAIKELSFEIMRANTLRNLELARKNFEEVEGSELIQYPVTFKFPDKEVKYPFWNFLNGHLMDAIYHTGQMVVLRRASGNPISDKVRVFHVSNAE